MNLRSRLIRNQIYVKPSKIAGYGVFAATAIQPGEIIEECYALQLNEAGGILNDFFFNVRGNSWLPLGYGAIYNHSEIPNAYFEYDTESSLITFIAEKPIIKNEEILVSYGKNWFKSRNKKAKELFWRYFWQKWQTMFWLITKFTIILLLLYSFNLFKFF